ncbi:MAG: Xaa-Pro peptidase family protein [Treponema sp.]|jgi:Xaa-Pro dipeptidase|nr:Xaa-Pro peptidase family protein [Treponema sp.]
MNVYEERRKKINAWMTEEGITMVMFQHTEDQRDPGIRWITGFPGDGLLFLSSVSLCGSLLIPWDMNLAFIFSDVESLIPYNDFERKPIIALKAALEFFNISAGSKIEIPPVTPYPIFLEYLEAIADFDVLCRNNGVHAEIQTLRAIKDAEEIEIYRHIAGITNELIDLLEKNAKAGKLKTEGAAALFIEAECRKRGCEGVGFETLAAGPLRSYGIHPFPAYTMGDFATKGLSILDFGVSCFGYTSDVTLTFAKEPLTKPQERMLTLTERAYRSALSQVQSGIPTKDIAAGVDRLFSNAKKKMPHALGHGIGLEAHEFPMIRNRKDNNWILKPGMIFTLEPGLYDMAHGGCRLENDILLTENGAETLTNARIIRL